MQASASAVNQAEPGWPATAGPDTRPGDRSAERAGGPAPEPDGTPATGGGRGRDSSTRPCPIERASDLLGDRWTLLILRDATGGATRFDSFRENLGIADNILATRLRRLTEAGVLVKVPYRDGNRTRHEYRLTPAGAELLPVLRALSDWGAAWTRPAEPSGPIGRLHTGCGGAVNVAGACDRCGRDVPREEEAWVRPWRSPEPFPLAMPVTAGD